MSKKVKEDGAEAEIEQGCNDLHLFEAKCDLFAMKELSTMFKLILELRKTVYEVADNHIVDRDVLFNFVLDQLPFHNEDYSESSDEV